MQRTTNFNLLVFFTSVFLLFIAHLPLFGFGEGGLSSSSNNFAWLFIVVIISLHFLKDKIIVLDRLNVFLGLSSLLAIFPFIINAKSYDFSEFLLPVALIISVIFFYVLRILYQKSGRHSFVLYLLFFSCCIQMVVGLSETIGALSYNFYFEEQVYNPSPLGVFNQRNLFSSFLATGICISIYLYGKTVSTKYSINRGLDFIHLIFVFLASGLMVYTNSRTGFLGVAIGATLLIILSILSKKKWVLWVVFALAGLLTSLYLKNVFQPIEKEIFEAGSRTYIYKAAFLALLDSPIIGHGLGSFEKVFTEKLAFLVNQGEIVGGAANLSHPHNEILYWGIQGGVVSILGLIIAALAILITIMKTSGFKGGLSIGLAVPILLHSQTEMPFLLSGLHWITVMLILASLCPIKACKSISSEKFIKFKVSKGFSSCILLICLTIFFINYYSLYVVNKYFNEAEEDIRTLNEVIYPVGWRTQYENVYYARMMNYGIEFSQPALIEDYIHWASVTINEYPRIEYYNNLALAHLYLGNTDEAKVIINKMEYYYKYSKVRRGMVKKLREQFHID